jgi:hypothetical protein
MPRRISQGGTAPPGRRSPSATCGFPHSQRRASLGPAGAGLCAAWGSSYTRCPGMTTASYEKVGLRNGARPPNVVDRDACAAGRVPVMIAGAFLRMRRRSSVIMKFRLVRQADHVAGGPAANLDADRAARAARAANGDAANGDPPVPDRLHAVQAPRREWRHARTGNDAAGDDCPVACRCRHPADRGRAAGAEVDPPRPWRVARGEVDLPGPRRCRHPADRGRAARANVDPPRPRRVARGEVDPSRRALRGDDTPARPAARSRRGVARVPDGDLLRGRPGRAVVEQQRHQRPGERRGYYPACRPARGRRGARACGRGRALPAGAWLVRSRGFVVVTHGLSMGCGPVGIVREACEN